MRFLLKNFAAVLLCFSLTPSVYAMGEWCGSRQHGDLNNLIPDSFRPQDVAIAITLCGWVPGGPSANFRPSCRAHDACYWTFGVDKKECDSRFRDDLEYECRETYHAGHRKRHKSCCIKAAFYYEKAVEKMGGDSYREAQKEARVASDLYREKTGEFPDMVVREEMAELCMVYNNNGGRCDIEKVVSLVIED
jgi:hypothetical protein